FDFLQAAGMRNRPDVPDVVEDFAGVVDEQSGELSVVVPGPRNGLLIDGARLLVEIEVDRRNVRLDAVHPNVALALLLGIVEGMRVQKRPDELAADVFQAELEVRVLIDGVMAAVKRGGADVQPLLVGDFLGLDEMRSVAGARRGNRGIKRMRESVAKRNARRSGLNLLRGTRAFEHAGLRCHLGTSFYRKVKNGERR